MDFASRISRLPRPYEADHGDEARKRLEGLSGELADLVGGAAGCSPYLRRLMELEGAWLIGAFGDPEAAVADEFETLKATEDADLAVALRRGKRRIAMITGLADLAGVWPLEQVTGVLTDFADLACDLALREAIGREISRGKLPGAGAADLADAGGMVVLAMGKMGAGELNYSSDIDLICLFDETRFEEDEYHDARASFVRATKRMVATLNDRTAQGYVFRTDLRLRPDPAVTPVCMAMTAAETYYESLGRTWERAAYIKARPAAGDIGAGQRFLTTLKPFVWRRHLDFAAIEDAHNMRLRIRSHKGLGGRLTLRGHNMKLGRGGIREIEFFTQTRQIIAGGRDPELRVRGTVEGLAALVAKGWVPGDVAKRLTENYRFHREVEHRLQMLRDAQTHELPGPDEEFDRLAAFMGRETGALRDELRARLQEVDAIIDRFFDPGGSDVAVAQSDVALDLAVIARWKSYPALRSARSVEIFNRLRPELLARLARASRPHEALLAFDGFLSGLPAGVQVFSLLEINPHLIDLLLDIAGTAPALAAHLARNASVFDAVIAGDFFAPWPGVDVLCADLGRKLSGERDYELKLDAARRWQKEWHFRIGVHHLRGLIDADRAGAHYADLADAVIRVIWPEVVAQFATRHGPPPGRGAVILGMGSLGAGRLNAGSDLDLIVIYDAQGSEASDGRRPLPSRLYFARLTQAMITALTAPMSQGRLYEVDMRLRPSGNQGPVATALTAFQDYQRNDAWVWEHLALTRARVIAGDAGLTADVEALRAEVLAGGHDTAKVLADVAEMRERIRAAKSPEGPLDAKLGDGRLQDVELIAQAATLIAGRDDGRDVASALASGVEIGWLDDADKRALKDAFALCWSLLMAARLLSDKALDPDEIGEGASDFLLRETGQTDMQALCAEVTRITARAGAVIDAHLAQT